MQSAFFSSFQVVAAPQHGRSSPQSPEPKEPGAPYRTARIAQVNAPDRAASAREFTLRLPDNLQKRVEVHLVESAGRVRVTVRSSDPQLTGALRAELGDLVHAITSKGLQIEAWTPPDTFPASSFQTPGATNPQNSEGGWTGPNPGGSGGQHARQQQQQQHEQKQSASDWLAELEAGLGKE